MIEKMREKKNKLYLGFMDLQQAYDRVNREALWQVLVIYGVGGRLLNGIKSVYDDSEACVRINGVNSDWFRINSGVRQGCVMSCLLFNVYMDCLLYTSDAADERSSVDLGGRRIIKKKKKRCFC